MVGRSTVRLVVAFLFGCAAIFLAASVCVDDFGLGEKCGWLRLSAFVCLVTGLGGAAMSGREQRQPTETEEGMRYVGITFLVILAIAAYLFVAAGHFRLATAAGFIGLSLIGSGAMLLPSGPAKPETKTSFRPFEKPQKEAVEIDWEPSLRK